MDEMMKKLMMKKKGSMGQEPDAESLEAKIKVLEELRDMMAQLMGEKMRSGYDDMKKVSIMAPSEEGLEEGLDTAKSMVSEMPELEEDEEEEEMV